MHIACEIRRVRDCRSVVKRPYLVNATYPFAGVFVVITPLYFEVYFRFFVYVIFDVVDESSFDVLTFVYRAISACYRSVSGEAVALDVT